MSQRRSFFRKIGYVSAIVVLLLPLSWLSQPATTESDGGKLAQLRQRYQLSQASLGEIDPASETMKLATLGMRGIAANLLWDKANYYKKVEDWTSLKATLEQITKLQPNFITVWRYQAWNLSYNVSVEFDDYRDRYYWVIKGIDFLKEGIKYNANEPRLLWDIGWFISQKIGRSDEHKQFRQMFKEDDDFHGSRPLARRDNWLVGREWFITAQDKVDKLGVPIRGMTPVLFYASPAMGRMNYADALAEEGVFGEVAKKSWQQAGEDWFDYGSRDIPTAYNFTIRLNDRDKLRQRSREAREKLAKLAPGIRDVIEKEKRAALSQEERDILETPLGKLNDETATRQYEIKAKIAVSQFEIANRVKGPDRTEALREADIATQADMQVDATDHYRGIVNFEFWKLKTEFEPTDDALTARRLSYDAHEAYRSSDIVKASQDYEESFKYWRKVLDRYPPLVNRDSSIMDELNETIADYRKVLNQLDEPYPKDFILADVVRFDAVYHNAEAAKIAEENPEKPKPAKAPAENPLNPLPAGAPTKAPANK